MVKCDKWIRDDDNQVEQSKLTSWFNRLIRRTKVSPDWPYPFVEDKLFVLTLTAGLEGYHVNVDGRHVTSFPYRTVSSALTSFSYYFRIRVQNFHFNDPRPYHACRALVLMMPQACH